MQFKARPDGKKPPVVELAAPDPRADACYSLKIILIICKTLKFVKFFSEKFFLF